MANYENMSVEQLQEARQNLLLSIRGLEEKYVTAGKLLEQKRLRDQAAAKLEQAQSSFDTAQENVDALKKVQPEAQVIKLDTLSVRGIIDRLRGV